MIAEARALGLQAFEGDALDHDLPRDARLAKVGAVLAATTNPSLNRVVAERWIEELGDDNVLPWEECVASDLEPEPVEIWEGRALSCTRRVSRALEAGELAIDLIPAGAPDRGEGRHLFRFLEGRAHALRPGSRQTRGERLVLRWGRTAG